MNKRIITVSIKDANGAFERMVITKREGDYMIEAQKVVLEEYRKYGNRKPHVFYSISAVVNPIMLMEEIV